MNQKFGAMKGVLEVGMRHGVFAWKGPRLRKKITKSDLWDIWFDINIFKFQLWRVRLAISKSRNEKTLGIFIERILRESPSGDLFGRDVVYGCIFPFTLKEYYGQSGNGLQLRVKTHNRHSRAPKGTKRRDQFLHRELRRLGTNLAIWWP
jgi:hypothetical protein